MGSEDYLEVRNPTQLQTDAAKLVGEGETLQGKATTRVTAITGIEAEAPWGGDHFGEAFLKGYQGENGESPSSAVQKALLDLAESASTIGNAVSWATVTYPATDDDNAKDISSVGTASLMRVTTTTVVEPAEK